VPLCDKEGNITGIIGVGRDITERKRMEMALLESLQEPEVQPVVVAAAPAIPANNPFADKPANAAAPTLAAEDDTPDDGNPLSLRRVRQFWPQAIQLIEQYSEQYPEMRMLPTTMGQLTVKAVQGTQVTLASSKAFYLDKLDAQKLKWIARALKRVLDLAEEPQVVRADTTRSGAAAKATSRDPLINVASELGATVRTVADKDERGE
ncbi:hypothetical protein HC776_03375, partial [bacterium]|nr:hypothetical protein [bacterium]